VKLQQYSISKPIWIVYLSGDIWNIVLETKSKWKKIYEFLWKFEMNVIFWRKCKKTTSNTKHYLKSENCIVYVYYSQWYHIINQFYTSLYI